MPDARRPVGSVHGRFQPFHNEHLEYVLAAKRHCEFLWIGITKYDISPIAAQPLARARERPENNPLTYPERVTMITAALTREGVRRDEFDFTPFPIETPHRLAAFVPNSIPCYTTVCEEWNREKIRVLQSFGYEVVVLWERDAKRITGSIIRDDVLVGGSNWKSMVPRSVADALEALTFRERLRQLGASGEASRLA